MQTYSRAAVRLRADSVDEYEAKQRSDSSCTDSNRQ